MERRFSMNDFEQSLKEQADEFKMIPSKRVWHGIYNDLHPGRRWPSIAMSLALIFTLVVIGHLNTHNGAQHRNLGNIFSGSQNVTGNHKALEISQEAQKNNQQKQIAANVEAVIPPISLTENVGTQLGTNLSDYTSGGKNLMPEDLPLNSNGKAQSGLTEFEKYNISFPELNTNMNNTDDDIPGNVVRVQSNLIPSSEAIREKIAVNNSDNLQIDQKIGVANTNLQYTKRESNNNSRDKDLQENKKPANTKQRKNDKISWVYFAAPELTSVSFSGQPIGPLNSNTNYKVLDNPALGFEGGIQMNHGFAKKLEFTTGLHITYSGYNIISNEMHPTDAYLYLKDPETGNIYSKDYYTHYGNGNGQTVISIRNYNLQASIPLGFQYEALGDDKVQLKVAADFEPSIVIKNRAYILSSDGKNYLNDPYLLRRVNMSSNFGAFVTFSSAKLRWQVGPNVRYQWLSTYKKDYTVKEHLIDYGIRIGISPIRK
jgi:hypothetical protein